MNARLDAALARWRYVAPLLTPATNEAEYRALVDALDAILDAGARAPESVRALPKDRKFNATCRSILPDGVARHRRVIRRSASADSCPAP